MGAVEGLGRFFGEGPEAVGGEVDGRLLRFSGDELSGRKKEVSVLCLPMLRGGRKKRAHKWGTTGWQNANRDDHCAKDAGRMVIVGERFWRETRNTTCT